jgi:F-type H+-transporting ATPase subunit alpha
MRRVAGRLRLDLAQFRNLASFAQFGSSDLDEATRRQLEIGQRMTEILKQPQYQPLKMEEAVASLYAVGNGYMDDVEVERVSDFEQQMLSYLRTSKPDVLNAIGEKRDLDEEAETALKAAIEEFKKAFV